MSARSILAAALVLAAWLAPAAAETAPLDRFYGQWQGTGLADDADARFFAMGARDLDVRIEPSGDGFKLTWITLTRGGNAANPEVQRREQSLTFDKTDRPFVFQAEDSASPLEGGILSWARLHDATLSVYQMALSETGGFELFSYDRTLTQDGMELVFRRLRDGDQIRAVHGRLNRVAE